MEDATIYNDLIKERVEMNEKTRRRLIFKKVLYLMRLKQESEVLEQKLVSHIITTGEKQILVHLHQLERITLNELSKLYNWTIGKFLIVHSRIIYEK